MTFRLVPDQDPARVTAAFESWLAAAVPDGAEVTITPEGGVAPALTPVDHPAMGALCRAVARVWGKEPLFTRIGGSGPEEALGRVLDVPVLYLGVALPDDRFHAPNERMVLDQFWKGLLAAGELWTELGALGRDRGLPVGEPEREWVSLEDDDECRTWVFDVTFLLSRWSCIYGNGCQGVLTGPAPDLEQGCCSYGAHFTDQADADRVVAAAATLGPDVWQFHAVGQEKGVLRKSPANPKVTRHGQGCLRVPQPARVRRGRRLRPPHRRPPAGRPTHGLQARRLLAAAPPPGGHARTATATSPPPSASGAGPAGAQAGPSSTGGAPRPGRHTKGRSRCTGRWRPSWRPWSAPPCSSGSRPTSTSGQPEAFPSPTPRCAEGSSGQSRKRRNIVIGVTGAW